jgi:hypothetical protein
MVGPKRPKRLECRVTVSDIGEFGGNQQQNVIGCSGRRQRPCIEPCASVGDNPVITGL